MGGLIAMSEIQKEGRHAEHIRIKLPFNMRDQFMMNVPKGLSVRLYASEQTDPNQWVDPDETNLTVIANENEPDPQYRRHKEDVDAYLATINTVDSRIKILNDKVTKKEQSNLMEAPFIKNVVLLDHPGLDDRDDLRSKAANKRRVEISESQLMNLEQRYDAAKKDFVRKKASNAEDTGKVNPANNEKIFTVEQGEL
jgi:hypothetical protein